MSLRCIIVSSLAADGAGDETQSFARLRIDTGSHAVRLPKAKQRAAVTALAQKFVAYDQTRPKAERNPATAKLEALLAEAVPCADDWVNAERRRTIASEAVKRLDSEAKQLVSQIWHVMISMYKDTPSL